MAFLRRQHRAAARRRSAAISLAASASFDRLAAPLGIGLAVLLLGYVLEILGTLWPDAAFLQPSRCSTTWTR